MRKAIALLAAGALIGLAACGDDEEESAGTEVQTLSASVDARGRLRGIEDMQGGTTTLRFRNGARDGWDLQLIKVDGNHPVSQVIRVFESEGGPIPSWMHGAGGVGVVKPGRSASATQVLGPGKYYAIAQQESEDGDPRRATAAFAVSGGESDGELPATDASIEATEYRFAAEGLKTGRNRVRFANEGRELHHAIAVQLAPGRSVSELREMFESEGPPKGPPPIVEGTETGTAVIDGRTSIVADLDFAKPGKWALVCFIPDRKGGPPHVAKGMVTEVTVE